MKGYPKGFLIKQDYVNLLSMPEYAKQAKEDLARLAAIDDAKATVEQGTEEAPNPVEIDNPMPMWKRAVFKDKDELLKLADLYPDIEELITDLQKLVPATQTAISDTAEAR